MGYEIAAIIASRSAECALLGNSSAPGFHRYIITRLYQRAVVFLVELACSRLG